MPATPRGRAEAGPVFDNLNVDEATTHFNGMIASIRYLDTFAKSEDTWLFAERRLYVDWTDTRPSFDSARDS